MSRSSLIISLPWETEDVKDQLLGHSRLGIIRMKLDLMRLNILGIGLAFPNEEVILGLRKPYLDHSGLLNLLYAWSVFDKKKQINRISSSQRPGILRVHKDRKGM